MKNLINMDDGGLLEVNYEGLTCLSSGCETCGYGGDWINNINITMEHGNISIEIHSMYNWIDVISESDFMYIITSNIETIKGLTEKQFAKWIKEKLINSGKIDDGYAEYLKVKYCEEM